MERSSAPKRIELPSKRNEAMTVRVIDGEEQHQEAATWIVGATAQGVQPWRSRSDRHASLVGLAWRASWGRSYRLLRRNGLERSDRLAGHEGTRCKGGGL